MTPDARDRFTGAAAGYARYRPSYPPELVDWVVAEAGLGAGDPVADVGCGTGISTRLFAERGLGVVGIDPNPDMLGEARAAGGARYLPGEGAATGLADASVKLVVVAQALHWLELDSALAEISRILEPGGSLAALYNLRTDSPFMGEYDALLRRFSTEYGVLESWQQALAALEAHPRVRDPRRREQTHAQQLDLDGLFGRALSSSYVFRGVGDRDGFSAALSALHARHAQGGVVAFPYRALALVVRLA